ncbi:hypothetical protein [Amycolatopsis pigmentata]|uniref:hypothetical protein n=1 Tax=Amycolatopsis pigmentata TaxID=450801 RepID=UPI00366D51C7
MTLRQIVHTEHHVLQRFMHRAIFGGRPFTLRRYSESEFRSGPAIESAQQASGFFDTFTEAARRSPELFHVGPKTIRRQNSSHDLVVHAH